MTPPPRQWLRRTKTPRAVRRRADPPTANQRVAAPGVVLLTLLVAVFMGPFDFFVVNVAAPPLRHDLHSSDAGLELIVGGYAFSYAGALVLGGRLGDIFGVWPLDRLRSAGGWAAGAGPDGGVDVASGTCLDLGIP